MITLAGRYQLRTRIGIGGMSEVWSGQDTVLRRPVAVKLLPPDGSVDSATYRRIHAEACAAARLNHPNIASVYDFGSASAPGRPRTPFIVMELVTGPSLAGQLLGGPLPWQIGVRVAAELCAGLATAHGHDIIHRDVKPGNLLLSPAGTKILDFGIATSIRRPEARDDDLIVGTPAYLSPEQLHGEPVGPAVDMWAVGVLLYQTLTGDLPWTGTHAERRALLRTRHRPAPRPLPAHAGLPAEVVQIAGACLDPLPGNRPTSLAAALVLAETVDARVYIPPEVLGSGRGVAPPSAADLEMATEAGVPIAAGQAGN